MKVSFRLALLLAATTYCLPAQTTKTSPHPKLIVGIVVDQLRAELLYRFAPRFGEKGFKRLMAEGFYFRNAHFNYVPTYTGPGHASIYTGTTPRHHGIIANDWFSRDDKQTRYCAYDPSASTVGSDSESGKMSPKNLLSTTIGDELKLATVKRGKVFAVAVKDRSAVLPAGHMADGAFWLDENNGVFVSSSAYLKELPPWLKTFNSSKPVQAYLSKGWQTLYPLDTFTASLPDNNPYENSTAIKESPVFPYDFSTHLKNGKLSVIRNTPYGNSITKDVALACIKNEALGKDDFTDMISISFSSTDIIGHNFGPRSVEIEDTYLRLDKDLEELLALLDKEVGKQNYVVFLTADHGASDVPRHLSDEKVPSGFVYDKNLDKQLKAFCNTLYHDTAIVQNVSNEQVFLDRRKITGMNLDQELIEKQICEFLTGTKGIAAAYPASKLKYENASADSQLMLIQNGYNWKLSGDIAYLYEPGYLDFGEKGTSHGSGYVYDTHVPVLFYGGGIPRGEEYSYVTITQIAATITELIGVGRPSASTGQPLNNFFRIR